MPFLVEKSNYFRYGTVGDIFLTLLLVLLGFALLLNIVKRIQAEKKVDRADRKLRESYNDLKMAYDEVSSAKTELYEKCDELRENKEKMKDVAYTDYLTKLPNRVAFMDKLENEVKNSYPKEYFTLIDLDLDDFKVINDTQGHLSGDAVICSVADRLRAAVGPNDYIGRVGGDEFILLFSRLKNREECEKKAVEIMHIFSVEHFKALDEKELSVSASMGVLVISRDNCPSVQTLTRNLDTALFVAKDSGKNTYRIFDSSLEQMMSNRVKLQADMREAIFNNQFELYYQPQINLDTNRVTSFEALIRWHHPQKGLLFPDEFIPVAEECGLIIEIGKIVLNKACKQLAEWHRAGNKVMVAVNLSAKQFRDPFLIDYVMDMINEYGIDPRYLELEITETVAIDDFNYAVRTIEKLKQHGILFSLDDFGTGYSSLNYLKQLPVDNLKIDKSFMEAVTVDNEDRKIVEAIISLAQALNMIVVAEGVEENAQEEMLKRMNCNKAQGFLYSRPVPANVASLLLSR
ncbi:MAG: bifunctional diguanylate cyclase/phosphodiesterase [Lachnospiraceae bacterium]|nr:bifunctional diguanylate cyclase/phosphodiesterase [Lachnospiraceae bacterium]